MDSDVLSVERVIPFPPEVIFDLLSDPANHPLIDGSGTVVTLREAAPGPLTLGSKFTLSLRVGVPCAMVSEVVEFEQDRRIAWQSRPPGFMGRVAGGRTWRYELEPADGDTKVRQSSDLSAARQRRLLALGHLPERTTLAMQQSLERLELLATDRIGRPSARRSSKRSRSSQARARRARSAELAERGLQRQGPVSTD